MSSFDRKKILIVGGAGFVGGNLCHHLLNEYQPEKLVIVDNFLSSPQK